MKCTEIHSYRHGMNLLNYNLKIQQLSFTNSILCNTRARLWSFVTFLKLFTDTMRINIYDWDNKCISKVITRISSYNNMFE